MPADPTPARIRAGLLDIAYLERGDPSGPPVLLLHGFPYDARICAAPARHLAECRVIVPWLRGYGETRFLSPDTPRSGQQAALAADLLALLDALGLERAILAGHDWGGRAACIVAALHPERVAGLVSCNGYNIQNIAAAAEPLDPAAERRLWYQHLFRSERGRDGLAADRQALARLLWQEWSPSWRFTDAEFAATAASFENPDYVDVVIHSYRHRFGDVPGDPAFEPIERQLAAQPPIPVPTVALQGAEDGVQPPETSAEHHRHFTGPYTRQVLPGVGHNPLAEAPETVADTIRTLATRPA